MGTNTPSEAMNAVNAWIRYIEQFGTTEITVQRLVNHGYSYPQIIRLLDRAVLDDEPINTAALFEGFIES